MFHFSSLYIRRFKQMAKQHSTQKILNSTWEQNAAGLILVAWKRRLDGRVLFLIFILPLQIS